MIRYRKMQPKDTQAVFEMNEAYFHESWTKAAIEKILTDSTMLYITAVDENDEPVGYCGLYQVLDEGNITQVAVHESMRGMRIGTGLMKELLEAGDENGIRFYTLEVRAKNQSAIALYEAAGFEQAGIRKNYYKNPDEDGIIMNRICK